ncbi:glutamate receptor ionotropic, kainate glr-3-like [Palaemon carinicauda]|uniref:glutamate receptor ionotropic, kainate glr-3-like n=1 Tax=Palaemon carinicauda TaxID=392227 RepID=UPI0035B57D5F
MALSGRHLRVGCELWLPWVNITEEADGTVTTSGVCIDLLNVIAEKLNFTYSFYRPSDREWGRELPNGSFTGMIGMCQRKEVDVALGPFVMAWDRFQAADFSTTIHFDQYGIILPRPRREVDLSGVAKPLSWQVWMSLGISICISLLIGLIINQIRKNYIGGDRGPTTEKIQTSWITKVMLAENVNPLPRAPTARMYIITWMLVGLIMHAAYGGVLISLLVVPKVTVPVDSLEDLLSYGKIPWTIIAGSYIHNIFQKIKEGIFKEVLDKAVVMKNYDDENLLWGSLKRDKMALFTPVIGILKHMSDDYTRTGECNFYLAREGVLSAPYALAFPKESELIPLFDTWLNAQKESGLFSHSILKVTTNVTACMVRPGKEGGNELHALTFMDLSGIFFLFGIGTGISFLIFIIEVIVKRL